MKRHIFVSIICVLSLLSASTLSAHAMGLEQVPNFEVRQRAAQQLYQYDIAQGSCTDGTYGYYTLFNRQLADCKIVKVRLSDMNVIQVSQRLHINHGNDLTYNERKKQIIVVHSGNAPRKISAINPDTLTKIYDKTISVPKKHKRRVKGLANIAYSENRNQYVAQIKGSSGDFVIMTTGFKVKKYLDVKTKYASYMNQAIDCDNNYIYKVQCVQRSNQRYNILTKWTWSGEYKGKKNINQFNVNGMLYEIESLFHVGQTFYAYAYTYNYPETIRNCYVYRVSGL